MSEILDDLKSEVDFLLVDSPPIMATADSAVLASKADGVLMVVTLGETRYDTFRDAFRQIQRAGAPIMGYVVNKVKTRRLGYGGYRYRYQYYDYYHRDDGHSDDGTRPASDNGDAPMKEINGRIAIVAQARRQMRNFLNRSLSRRR